MNRLFKTISMVVTASVVLSTPIAGLRMKTVRAASVSIKNTSIFPNSRFQDYLFENYDTDKDWYLSDEERNNVTSIDIHNSEVTSLKGIELFPNLIELDCSGCGMTSLDLRANAALTTLECRWCEFTSLNLSNNTALTTLICAHSNLSSLNLRANTALTTLDCQNCGFTSLDLSNNTALTTLDCRESSLSKLELNNNTALTVLSCNNCSLDSLDVSANTALRQLACEDCGLNALNLGDNTALTSLFCSLNNLTELDVSDCTALETLHCTNNNLTELSINGNSTLVELQCSVNKLTKLEVSECTALETLYCSGNELTELDASGCTTLIDLRCANNLLTKLDVSGCAALESLACDCNELTELDIGGCAALESLECYWNELTELDISDCELLSVLCSYGNKIDFIDVENCPELWNKIQTYQKSSVTIEGYSCNAYHDGDVLGATIVVDSSTDLTKGTLIDKAFPDVKFREYVAGFDLDHDGVLDSSEKKAVKAIDVHGLGIADLTGIELFTELEELNCSNNSLAKLDLSKNTKLTVLDCSNNQLAALDVSANTALTKLYCYGNKISKLSIEKCAVLLEEYKKCIKFTVKDADSGISYFEFKTDNSEPCLKTDTKTGILPNVLIPTPTNTPTPKPTGTTPKPTGATTKPTPTGVTPKPTGATPKPTDVTPKPTGVTPKPTGVTPKPTGVTPKPTGVTPKPTGVTPKPTGVTPKPTGVTPKPTGATPKPTGATPKPTGVTPKPTGVTPKPDDPTPTPEKEPSIADFVERLYTVALNRASEPEGKAYWVKEIENGNRTGGDCAHFFLIEAEEFRNRGLNEDDFVETLYLTFFDRASEPNGKAFWVGQLKSGAMTRNQVISGFIDSTEWCNVCATYGVKSGAPNAKAEFASKNAIKFATRLYTCCLGREPEEGGLNYWSLALTNLEQTGCSAAKLFFTSDEFVNFKLKDDEYVRRLYTTFMGRDPEASEIAYWVGEIAKGTQTKESVMAFFGQSPEFTNICKKYGIDRGTI